MKNYLLYEGFGRFSPAHLIWLCIGVYAAKSLYMSHGRLDAGAREKLRLTLAATAAGFEVFRLAMLFLDGLLCAETLPLQLYSASALVCLAHALGGGELPGQFLYGASLPALALAMLMPPWSGYGAAHYMTVAGFGGCICVGVYVLLSLAEGRIVPDARRAPACLGLLALGAASLRLFNLFMDTQHSLLGPVAAVTLSRWAQSLWQQPLLAAIPVLGWLVMYLPFMLTKKAAD